MPKGPGSDNPGVTISGHVTEYRRGGIAFWENQQERTIAALLTALTIRRANPFRSIDYRREAAARLAAQSGSGPAKDWRVSCIDRH
jgi:hypothetical protein